MGADPWTAGLSSVAGAFGGMGQGPDTLLSGADAPMNVGGLTITRGPSDSWALWALVAVGVVLVLRR